MFREEKPGRKATRRFIYILTFKKEASDITNGEFGGDFKEELILYRI